MRRLKLFTFFAGMAWASLLKPKHGIEMIQDALEGAESRALRERAEAVFSQSRRKPKLATTAEDISRAIYAHDGWSRENALKGFAQVKRKSDKGGEDERS